MNYDLLGNITITDEDIDWVETILSDVTFDERRRNIIKNMNTIDIQAFPGSGKTTVLVAKLAILAKKWPFSNRGLCVLSHTNVARDEIEKRLWNTDVGKKMLRYPHFIGTFHSFFDTFVGIPWLRSHGHKIKIIDSASVKEMRWQRLKYGTRIYLEKNFNTNDCCQAISLPIEIEIKRAGSQTNTYKNVVKEVKTSLDNGEYTFFEMLLIAKEALQCVTCLPSLIVSRFPLLFIDEAQDTYANQWELLDMAFPSTIPHIRQCFGDQNQAIYQSYEAAEDSSRFPRGTPLTLPDSKRFGQHIATLANSVSLSKEIMEGKATAYSHLHDKNTVFLFDADNPQAVINAYKSLILSCFSDEDLSDGKSDGCYVIGMVHNQNDQNEKHRPRNIHDYWANYDDARALRTPSPKLLVEYFRIGQQTFAFDGKMSTLIDWIARGLRQYLNQFNNRAISVAVDALKAICSELSSPHINELRRCLFSLAMMSIKTEYDWSRITDEVARIAVSLFGLSAVKNSFLDWKEETGGEKNAKRLNCCTLHDDETKRELTLYFGSIHSVKGRTHLSTLVVETYWNDHNIKSLLPWLCCCAPNKQTGRRNINRLKCHYVAFTRARALLCIAIPKNSITQPQIDKLRNNGWSISDIT